MEEKLEDENATLYTDQDVEFFANQTGAFRFAQRCLDFLNFYYLALIIAVGMVGNILSFLVFTRTHLKLRSSSCYLAALALSDLGFLVSLLLVWVKHVGIDLFNQHGWCQSLVYCSSVCSCLSVWLTVAFTVERLIAVQYPLQRPSMCTVRRAKTIIVVLTFIGVTSHIYSLITAGIADGPEGMACRLLPQYYRAMQVVNLLDTFATLIIPFILIVVMNAMIARNLILFSRTFKKPVSRLPNASHLVQTKTTKLSEGWEHDSGQGSVSNPSVHSSNKSCHNHYHTGSHNSGRSKIVGGPVPSAAEAATLNTVTAPPHTTIKTPGSTIHLSQLEVKECNHDKLQYRNILSTRIQHSITKMLLLISTVFIMLNLPSYVIRLHAFINDVFTGHERTSPSFWLLQQFFMLLYYTNFSINFLLYSTCGVTFRHCLCRLIRDKIQALKKLVPDSLQN